MEPVNRPPVLLAEALPDPGLVEALLVAHAPYWPVQRYMANRSEYAALSGHTTTAEMPVAPVFRGDWAFDGRVADGVAPLLDHAPFVEGARTVFDADHVIGHTVYVNLTHQLPFAQGKGHTDIPAFRGFDRTTVPVPFLTIMGLSGLFEAERIKIATAVAWFYEGADGGFEYWPHGGEEPSVIHEGAIDNTAVVGDNDFMWHRVRPTGRPEDGVSFYDLDAELRHEAGAWTIVQDGATMASFSRRDLRVSLSWKATVYVDDAERERVESHRDDLDLAAVVDRFATDLAARGIDVGASDDPLHDAEYFEVLRNAYVRYPTSA